jgi:hypothetical protein
MHSIRRAIRIASFALAAMAVAAFPVQALAAKPDVTHQQFVTTGADLGVVNICGELADFRFSTEGSFTIVDMADGVFHYQNASRGTYTVTFLDTSLGVWDATIRSATSVQATPGGTFRLSPRGREVTSSRVPPIHEQTTYVGVVVLTAPFTWTTTTSMLRVVNRRRRAAPETETPPVIDRRRFVPFMRTTRGVGAAPISAAAAQAAAMEALGVELRSGHQRPRKPQPMQLGASAWLQADLGGAGRLRAGWSGCRCAAAAAVGRVTVAVPVVTRGRLSLRRSWRCRPPVTWAGVRARRRRRSPWMRRGLGGSPPRPTTETRAGRSGSPARGDRSALRGPKQLK